MEQNKQSSVLRSIDDHAAKIKESATKFNVSVQHEQELQKVMKRPIFVASAERDVVNHLFATVKGEQFDGKDYDVVVMPEVFFRQLYENYFLQQVDEATRLKAIEDRADETVKEKAEKAALDLWNNLEHPKIKKEYFSNGEKVFTRSQLKTMLTKIGKRFTDKQIAMTIDFLLSQDYIFVFGDQSSKPSHKVQYQLVLKYEDQVANVQKQIDENEHKLNFHRGLIKCLKGQLVDLKNKHKPKTTKKQKNVAKSIPGRSDSTTETPKQSSGEHAIQGDS